MFPTCKAKIIEVLEDVAPLCRVRALEIAEEKLTEE